ncbi:MAG: thioredoxin domain-containing protein [Sphingorhabdus sp.]|uniref:thioredoxin domain-containing protein n=1 Tax=Sphingorhabdus sp. TaxID=1902408 RepID=UPI0025EE2197|nr:thioredoxin domain-containing protein [Sphingorhabdus sp.]MCO4092097.1 thioredoxin domain-containing protein [Sphingorhabdus sp.]
MSYMKKKYLGAVLVGVMALSTALVAAPAPSKWLSTVTVTDKGAHILGNPAAPNKVVEYMSYTCGKCADFEIKEVPAFKTQFVASGKASLEIRNMVLNPFDLTAAMLARCGGKGKFFGNHRHLLATQAIWSGNTKNISAATREKLKSEDYTGFMVGTFDEIGLGPIMQKRGITPKQAKTCLADKTALKIITGMTDAGSGLGVRGTPAFLVNGVLQDRIRNVAELKAVMK